MGKDFTPCPPPTSKRTPKKPSRITVNDELIFDVVYSSFQILLICQKNHQNTVTRTADYTISLTILNRWILNVLGKHTNPVETDKLSLATTLFLIPVSRQRKIFIFGIENQAFFSSFSFESYVCNNFISWPPFLNFFVSSTVL